MKKYLLSTCVLILSALISIAQTPIYTQTFGSALGGWTSVDNNGTAGKWVRSTNPFTDPSYGAETYASPTGANGFALILSDGNGSALNTDLISPAINCAGQTYVALQFYQWIAIYSTAGFHSAKVYVSLDSLNWSPVFDVATQSTGANPEFIQMDISSYVSNQPNVWIKFNYQATNDLWWAIDDVSLLSLPANDVSVLSVNANDYIGISNFPVSTTIQNLGGATLNNVTLDYTVNGAGDVSQTFTGLGLPAFGTTTLTFNALAPLVTVQVDTLTVTSSSPNGGTDANTGNDVATKVVTTLSHVPVKNVLVEEFSTVPCGFCPGGATRVSEIVAADGAYAVPVSIHAGFYTDDMTNADATAIATALDNNGAPTASVDRVIQPKQTLPAFGVTGMGYDATYNDWKTAVETRQPVTPPVSIAAYSTYDANSRALSVTINSTFFGPVAGHFRMNCYLIEDSVVGSGTGYDQHSYYHDAPTSLNPWLGVGTTNLGGTPPNSTWAIAGYVHNHVERKLLDGTWGTAGVIPSTISDGGSYTKTLSYTLPGTINAAHASLVAFVYEYNINYSSGKNEVQNVLALPLNGADSIAAPLAVVSGIKETPANGLAQISLYPNPATDIVHVNYSLSSTSKLSFQVYNMMGQLVSNISESTFNQGDYQTLINTSKYQSGLYFVTVKNEGKVMQTLKFVINK